jgi:hypothetical protein
MNDSLQIRKSRELGEILGDSITFLKENIKYVFIPILVIGIIYGATYALCLYSGFVNLNPGRTLASFSTGGGITAYFGQLGFVYLLQGISSISIFIILYNLISFKSENPDQHPTTADLFKNFANQFFRLILYSIPLVFLLIFLFCLLIIPGIWFSVIFVFYFPVVFFERGSLGNLISRSRFLIKDQWWNSFLSFLVPAIIIGIIMAPFSLIISYFLLKNISLNPTEISVGLPTSVAYFFLMLFSVFLNLWPSSCIALQYFNLVEKKDNLGLSKNLDSLGIDSPKTQISGPQEY